MLSSASRHMLNNDKLDNVSSHAEPWVSSQLDDVAPCFR